MIRPTVSTSPKVLIIAPASYIEAEKLSYPIELLQTWGFEVIESHLLSKPYYQFAGEIPQRIEYLQMALDDPSIDIILCARGGYGTVHLIDHLDFEGIKKYPKWVVGFSDITALHICLYNTGIQSIHGPMPILFTKNTKDSLDALKTLLSGQAKDVLLPRLAYDKCGEGEGRLIGGNLSVLQTMIGTSTDFDTNGKILFLEEVHEPLYSIDRMLRHLHRAKKLDCLQALILGSFSDIKEEDPPFDNNLYEIVAQLTTVFDYPIVFDFPIGHEEDNIPLVIGQKYHLKVDESHVVLKASD